MLALMASFLWMEGGVGVSQADQVAICLDEIDCRGR
jgi:hypothetical protein